MHFESLVVRSTAATLLLTALVPRSGHAQADSVPHVPGFDVNRAMLRDRSRFTPFLVEETQLLSEALEQGVVNDDTPILVVERGGRRLALITREMTFHHVAQGEMAGEPWMVSF
jgi:hypothetical protein